LDYGWNNVQFFLFCSFYVNFQPLVLFEPSRKLLGGIEEWELGSMFFEVLDNSSYLDPWTFHAKLLLSRLKLGFGIVTGSWAVAWPASSKLPGEVLR
jgi:hypothetical protein